MSCRCHKDNEEMAEIRTLCAEYGQGMRARGDKVVAEHRAAMQAALEPFYKVLQDIHPGLLDDCEMVLGDVVIDGWGEHLTNISIEATIEESS